ncbi:hypothetical protein H8356DRAFT_1336286 [Neocallimastix lanati (nom. inval.)]|nr:hypothetical protein H8356DRAFT_1336286 [Neocallimastix sp. JGI-2020a]
MACNSSNNANKYENYLEINENNDFEIKHVKYDGCLTIVVYVGPYSAMSCIAEIKAIFGGFIIKQFLEVKTLIQLALSFDLINSKEGSRKMKHLVQSIDDVLFSLESMNPFKRKTVLFQATYDRDWDIF